MKFYNWLNENIKSEVKKIVILTTKPEKQELYRTASKLKKEAEKIGLETYIVFHNNSWLTKKENTTDYFIHNNNDKNGFLINNNDTIIIIRGCSSKFKSTLDLISQLEKSNFFIVNNRETIEICSDKFRTVLKLTENNISTPKSRLIGSIESIEEIVNDFGNKFPLVLKTISGSQGIGIMLSKDVYDLKAALQMIWKLNPETEILIQEYIEADRDYRIHVIGNKVIAGMERIKSTKDFRTNYSLGNKVKNIPIDKISEEMKKIAIKSAKTVNAIWCGVDIIKNKKGDMFVIEVNSSPGTSGIEKNTNLNLSKTIIEFSLNKNNWVIKPIEIGYKEFIEIPEIGKLKGKFDTGNGAYIVIHSNEFKEKNNYIYWKDPFEKNQKNKLEKMISVSVGGLRKYKENRPLILLDIKFNGVLYKDNLVCLDDRTKRSPVLLNRNFINKINAVINPNKKYTILQDE